jgi:hypothetical protein
LALGEPLRQGARDGEARHQPEDEPRARSTPHEDRAESREDERSEGVRLARAHPSAIADGSINE